MATGTGWAQLRQQIRTFESQTEALFHTYSQYASSSKLPPKPSDEEQRNEAEIQELLEKREALISQLSRLLDSESALSTSSLKQNNLSRHREVLTEHRQELRRLKSSVSEARDRQHLLANVRSDIDAFRTNNPAEAEAEYMLQERTRLDQSHSVIDGVLSQAYAINENFGIQRETLASINRRITGAAAQIPGVNGLIQRIGSKRRRDGIILGSFIAFCCLVFLYFS
ncbi:protein transport protein gos1 [Cladophialophora chaetospira]|uniref:Golgi SNAP receptor complex member 1 n=1 Tax=Cladophialophora chaetospira TaxID=386627 RepID=A0AA38X6S1_9EURO|nr:protein transport protein gos1 [Cladophialophora chaetospira]